MKVTTNTRRVFVFNIIMTIIRYSSGLDCITKAVYTKPDGTEAVLQSDEQESVKCAAYQSRCVKASGSIKHGDDEYVVESIQTCVTQAYCELVFDGKLLEPLLYTMDESYGVGGTFTFKDEMTTGSTPAIRECCQGDNCNTLQETSSSGYPIHKISFINILLLFVVSCIFFF